MRKRSLLVFLAALFVFALAPAATAQTAARVPTPALQIAPKPALIVAHWKPFIGEYENGKAVVNVLERSGKLFLSLRPDVSIQLNEVGPGHFTSADTSLRFVSDSEGHHELRFGGKTYVKLQFGDVEHSFHITPLRPVAELRKEALAAKPPTESGKRKPELVELTSLDPTIKLDIRYATSNNFMGAPFYTEARAFMQRPAAEAVVRANRVLHKYGYGVIIHDAYRPWFVTKMFWDGTPDDKKDFVADPAKGSNHNRGGAVDLSLYDLRTGKEVEMTGGYDEMSDRSYAEYQGGTSLQRWRRNLLRAAMEEQGFKVYKFEWWHFDYKDWPSYPVLNVSFEELSRSGPVASKPATSRH
jgi:D-alanyl-D-alanine dipeptidase